MNEDTQEKRGAVLILNQRRCEHCDAAPEYLEEVDGHPDFRKCIICTKLTCSPKHGMVVGIDYANGPDKSVVTDTQGNLLAVEAENDLECPGCSEAELVVLRGHDPTGKNEGAIIGFYCRNCSFQHTGTLASLQSRRQPDAITTGGVMRLLAEDQRKGSPGGGGSGCKVRRRPKAGERQAWREARRTRGLEHTGGRSGLSDNQVAKLKERKTQQLPPTRVGTDEKAVISVLQATGLNESEAVRTCINTFGRAVKALEENDALRARIAELEEAQRNRSGEWSVVEVENA